MSRIKIELPKPDYTELVAYHRIFIEGFSYMFKFEVSNAFFRCAITQLTKDFIERTGLKPSKELSLTHGDEPGYVEGPVSTLHFTLYVRHNWVPVVAHWQSNSGRIYKPADEDINCADLRFWFAPFDVANIHRLYRPKDELPFRLKNLTYQLQVEALNLDMELRLLPLPGADRQALDQGLDQLLESLNRKAEAKGGEHGVMHSWRSHLQDEWLIFHIDMGSAGMDCLKKILKYLSGTSLLQQVVVC